MQAILTIQGDKSRDTWAAVKAAARDATPQGWQIARIRAQPEKHKVVLDLVREDGE